MILRILILTFMMIPVYSDMVMGASSFSPKVPEHIRSDEDSAREIFLKAIPPVAEQFIGTPYRYGQDPRLTGATDNSYLFYSIYSLAAQKAGLRYKGYMPMKYLLQHVKPVSDGDIRNGDLMVLRNNLAAMVYQIEPWGKLHLLYTSAKRQQVISFTSDNIVFQAYWMENLKGFYRIHDSLLHAAK